MGAMARSSVVRDARDDDRGCGWRRGDGEKRVRLASVSRVVRAERARVTVVGRVGRSVGRSVDKEKKTPITFHTPFKGVFESICHVVDRHRNWDYRVIHYVFHSQRGY